MRLYEGKKIIAVAYRNEHGVGQALRDQWFNAYHSIAQ